MDLLTACGDERLFAPWFKDRATWRSWFVFIAALFGLPIEDAEERALVTRCIGRVAPPSEPASEAWIIAGRRSGKSFILSLVAVYLATFKDWAPHLARGERATVMVIACDRKQSRVIMRYINAFLYECPLLRSMIERTTRSEVEGWTFNLDNRVTIEVHTANFRTVRGYTIVAALLDEVAFWRSDEGASPDKEVLEAIRPAMATVPGSVLLAASSPYSRRGMLWDVYRRHWGKEGPVLCWQSDSLTMNPTIAPAVVEAAMERDQSLAASEWWAEFRSDLETFVARDAVEGCIEPGVRERPPVLGMRYAAFVDPSGGRQDSMTLAVAHREGDRVVLDCVRERRPPFSPQDVVVEFALALKPYAVRTVQSDRYGGEWVTAAFRDRGIRCEPAAKPKSDLYRELLPLINSGRVELLDHPKLIGELCSLERRVGRGGRDSIDHPPMAHDDLANACAGVLTVGQLQRGTIQVGRLLGI